MRLATVFSGIGSVEFALKRLSVDHEIVFACDIDQFVKISYQANYGDNIKWYDDITQLKGKIYRDKIDLFVGGSPCQSFSSAGRQQGLDDPRGQLIYQFIRLVKEIKPKVFIFENVKGLTTDNKGETWKLLIKEFDNLGYNCKHKILNAKNFGIPQHRERIFVVGILEPDQFEKFEFPEENKNLKIDTHHLLEDTIWDKKWIIRNNGSKLYNMSEHFGLSGDFMLKSPINGLDNSEYMRKYFLSEKVKKYILAGGTKGFYCKPRWDLKIAKPLLSTMHKMHRAGIDNYFKYDENFNKIDPDKSISQMNNNDMYRKFTPREALRLMGFDDRFEIVVSDTQIYRQAGNSIVVDVLLAILKQLDFLWNNSE